MCPQVPRIFAFGQKGEFFQSLQVGAILVPAGVRFLGRASRSLMLAACGLRRLPEWFQPCRGLVYSASGVAGRRYLGEKLIVLQEPGRRRRSVGEEPFGCGGALGRRLRLLHCAAQIRVRRLGAS